MDPRALQLPAVGDAEVRLLSPTVLELTLITSPEPNTTPPIPNLASRSDYRVMIDDQSVLVASVGFKRRVVYAPLKQRDLRVGNWIYLQLAKPIPTDAPHRVKVTCLQGTLWPAEREFTARTDASRVSPAIHVNQEGYAPALPKVAMLGYYLGSLGELDIDANDFDLVDAVSGEKVFHGVLRPRKDVGFTYTPLPYQAVKEADFSNFKAPGVYRLAVPGLGVSLPFRIAEDELMNFARTYALGIYHQRCGAADELPFTRFTHDACHIAPAEVPIPESKFAAAWEFIAKAHNDERSPDHPAPFLKSEATQLYPFVRRGKIDVSGGHHDAGDYSKYTMNSAAFVHTLIFAVDSLPGVAALDNLGLPESGDGISDLLQEAKWEADFLAKMQDADGGFYFLVYPRDRAYEGGVTPDHGDAQIVWPKNTAATAAAVAALAQCASSPQFKQHYPNEARGYLQQAKLGWKFLLAAIAKHGKAGAYQKLTHYGDTFRHDDELAWAACELFVATGENVYRDKLYEWYPDPTSGDTRFWGWWHAAFSYGNALRSYAFAARSGRLRPDQLDANYLAKCEAELRRAGNDAARWSQQNAYGTSFPEETKHQRAAGWYFSSDQAFDATVAYQLDPRPAYAETVIANVDYELGTNPSNVSFITGLGQHRQREIVHQWAQADRRVLPPSGIPLGNLQASFDFLPPYQNDLRQATYPADDGLPPYPIYDRWSDAYNVTTEFVITNQARSLASLAFWAAQTDAAKKPWRAARARIVAPGASESMDKPATFRLVSDDVDLTDAEIVWEARDAEPTIGPTFLFSPKNSGPQWVEAEAQFPDGRRVFATASFTANSSVVYWIDGALPAGAVPTANGGDTWNWSAATDKPAGLAGRATSQHQSTGGEPLHEHSFTNAESKLLVGDDDVLFAYVCIDPQNPPEEIMLSWNDGSWEHRAYWGRDKIDYGKPRTPGRRQLGPLPKPGEWVRLEVPAREVGLAGHSVKGMSFSLYGGHATWDAAGKMSRDGSS
ncbi:MAG TPA: glycoside hydrolase family 9 protein [Opitutaceae bacterium]|nr:glycoside hydrolase family 9 protein [Opitutaceae bacterium]